jgi:NAD(P)-dependent dehydrogenase (short-subunit alcohol dehydrogenase family)
MTPYKKPKLNNIHYDHTVKGLPELSNITVAITGTTSGTGFVAALTMAKKGARVICLNRPSKRANIALNAITEASQNDVIGIDCDLQSFESVREAANMITRYCPNGLNILCNNAGVMALKDTATPDGFDIQMQVNHLSHFLLTKKLFPLLDAASKKVGEARIVNHSSIARFGAKILEAKYLEKRGGHLGGNGTGMMLFPGGRWVRYAQTKLANCAFTSALHAMLMASKSSVKAMVAHPGLSVTDLQSTTVSDGGMGQLFTSLFMRGGQTQWDGALGIITAMAAPNINSGSFIGPGAGKWALKGAPIRFELEPFYNNNETMNMMWEKSCEAIGESFTIGSV